MTDMPTANTAPGPLIADYRGIHDAPDGDVGSAQCPEE